VDQIAKIPDCVLENIYFGKDEEAMDLEVLEEEIPKAISNPSSQEASKSIYEDMIRDSLFAQGMPLSVVNESITIFRQEKENSISQGESQGSALEKGRQAVEAFVDGVKANHQSGG
jgi:hypothetical protein